MSARLALYLLGPPRLELDNEPLVIDRRKTVALLAYLALNSGQHTRDFLSALLWPEHDQAKAFTNLRHTLWETQQAIGEGWILAQRDTIGFIQPSDPPSNREIWVDVHQLSAAIRTKNLDVAVSLYRGDFLESFYLKGANEFENWQVIERDKIRLGLIDGLSDTVHLLMKAGKSKEAIKYLKHLLTLEPLLESAHRQLMQAYFDNGEVTLALKQFEVCRQALSGELSVTPAEETLTLFSHIAGHRPSAIHVSAIPHNLPNFTTPFIGQIEKIRELFEILSDPEVKHLSLVGPGGYGKSRLALHLAKKCTDQFPDGVFWVSLQELETSSQLPATIADAIGLIHQTEKEIKDELLDYLGSRQALLVLDNFEHLLTGARLVSEILRISQNVKVITTTRQKLNLKGETTYLVRGMHYPLDEELAHDDASLRRYDAIQLFIKSASRSIPSFKPGDEEQKAIARICRSVDGMPLAIELAAGWVSVLSLSDIEEEINKGFAFLAGELQDVEDRHQSLRAVAGQSWSMLTDVEKSVFKKLAILKGPFTRKSAEAIAAAELNTLLSLSNKSFLQKDSEGLFRIHEWLRQFGESELRRSEAQFAEALELFSQYYVTYLSESWWEAWSGECQPLRFEWRNISEALLIVARAGNLKLLGNGMLPFFFVSYLGEDFNASAGLFSQMAAEFEKRDLAESERLTYAACLVFYAYFLRGQNKHEQVLESYEKVEDLIRGCDRGPQYAWIRAFEYLDHFYSDREKFYEYAQQTLNIFTSLKDDYGLAFTYNVLARRSFGDTKRANCHTALVHARKHNGTRDTAWAFFELGRLELAEGEFEKAAESLTEALARYTAIRSSEGMAFSYLYLGTVAHNQGKYSQAKEYYLQAIGVCDRAGFKSFMMDCKEALGTVAIAMQDYELGRQLILEATASAVEKVGDKMPFWVSPPEVSLLLDHLGDHELAVILLASSLNHPMGQEYKSKLEEQLEGYKSRHPGAEISNWIEKGHQIKPIELATAIRDVLSGVK